MYEWASCLMLLCIYFADIFVKWSAWDHPSWHILMQDVRFSTVSKVGSDYWDLELEWLDWVSAYLSLSLSLGERKDAGFCLCLEMGEEAWLRLSGVGELGN